MIQTLRADLDIRRLLAVYTDAVWRKDAVAYAACWSTDAEWKILGMHLKGRAAIVGFWEQIMSTFQWTYQVQHSPILEIKETTAVGRVYVDEKLSMKDGSRATSFGAYHDLYVVEGESWKFSRRHFDLIYMGPADLSGRVFGPPVFGPAPHHLDPTRSASPPMSELFPAP